MAYKKCFFLFFTLLIIAINHSPLIAKPPSETCCSKFAKIYSIDEIQTSQPKETIFFFDIDDTLFDSPYMLGSKAWRKYITQATQNCERNWHDILSLYIAQNLQMATVESGTSELIKNLQKQGYAVCGLTARERNIWYDTPTKGIDLLTLHQLAAVDIILDHASFEKGFPGLAQDNEYFAGVFFANEASKGSYLRKILENSASHHTLPEKIIFIDDKLSHVEAVLAVLQDLNIDHECYWYCATDNKSTTFNPLIANIQLYYFLTSQGKVILCDQEAELIGKRDPKKSADYYLNTALNVGIRSKT